MKLKNVLVLTFLTLTLIPIIIVSFLMYKSGFNLAKESYTRNLVESITVQVDYITQTIENNMIYDYRFVNRKFAVASVARSSSDAKKDLLAAFQSYLEASEDKITVCILLDKDDIPIYSIGEKTVLNTIDTQLKTLPELKNQKVIEFELKKGTYSLGVVTPILDANDAYAGSLISIYDKAYIFKIISSYYKISDTFTYICRANGDIINFRQSQDSMKNDAVAQALGTLKFADQGVIDIRTGYVPIVGYYKNIHNTPWYLVGFIDEDLISAFTNQFISLYIVFIIGVLLADVFLSFYFSRKVVEPINSLIKVMERYQNSLNSKELQYNEKNGYFETQYLRTKFTSLMKTILLFQHNFEGMYQLYQSNDMGDINIDIDVQSQTVVSNKSEFRNLMENITVSERACIVERFTRCFCDNDQILLMNMFENMRDEHLSVTREAEVYTPYLNRKWFHSLVVPMYEDDRLSRLFIQLRDVSNFKIKEMASLEQARRDALTGLYNRTGFAEAVNKAVLERRKSDLHALLFIDMNFFKLVNDNLGHSTGDDVLRSVGTTLLDAVGPEDVASRFGGDEFAVFLLNTTTEAITEMVATLKERLVYPFTTEKITFAVSASIGVSTWTRTSPTTLEDLMQEADIAMYQAKRTFKSNKSNLPCAG